MTVIYTVFLTIYLQNFFQFERVPKAGKRVIGQQFHLHILVNSSNIFRILVIGLLFFSDWIIFTIIFPPKSIFQFKLDEALLFFGYLPVLIFLGFAVISALDCHERTSKFIAYYHFSAIVTEVTWIVYKLASSDGKITLKEVAIFFIFTFLYFMLRFILGVFLILRGRGNIPQLSFIVLYISSLILKPVYILFVKSLSVVNKILGG